MAEKALKALIWATIPNALIAFAITVFRYFGKGESVHFASLSVLFMVLASTGTICYVIRSSDPANVLLRALRSVPPHQEEARVLHLIPDSASEEAMPALLPSDPPARAAAAD